MEIGVGAEEVIKLWDKVWDVVEKEYRHNEKIGNGYRMGSSYPKIEKIYEELEYKPATGDDYKLWVRKQDQNKLNKFYKLLKKLEKDVIS